MKSNIDIDKYNNYCNSVFGKRRRDLIYSQIKLNCFPYKIIYDLGCGTGCITEKFFNENIKIIAIDKSQLMLDKFSKIIPNNKKNKILYEKIDVIDFFNKRKTPLNGLILCHNVIDYFESKTDFLINLKNISNSKTIVSLTVVNLLGELNNLIFNGYINEANKLLNTKKYFSNTFKEYLYLLTPSDWLNLFLGLGWEVIHWYGIGYLSHKQINNFSFETELMSISSFKENSNLLHFILKRGINAC